MLNDDGLIPFSGVCFEIGISQRDLERRANGSVTRNGAGLRCVPIELCQELVAERDERLAAQYELQDRQRAQRQADQEQRRIEAQAARERRETLREQNRDLASQGLSAAEVMTLAAGEFERRAEQSPTGDYMRGSMEYRSVEDKEQ